MNPLTEPFGWPKRETGRACRKRSFRAGRWQKQKPAPASWRVCGRGRPEVYQTRRRKELHAPKRRRNINIIRRPAKLLGLAVWDWARDLPLFENGVPSPVAHVTIDPGHSERHDARGSFGRYQSAMKGSASKLPPLMQARAAGGQRLSALAALRGSNPAPSQPPTA